MSPSGGALRPGHSAPKGGRERRRSWASQPGQAVGVQLLRRQFHADQGPHQYLHHEIRGILDRCQGLKTVLSLGTVSVLLPTQLIKGTNGSMEDRTHGKPVNTGINAPTIALPPAKFPSLQDERNTGKKNSLCLYWMRRYEERAPCETT